MPLKQLMSDISIGALGAPELPSQTEPSDTYPQESAEQFTLLGDLPAVDREKDHLRTREAAVGIAALVRRSIESSPFVVAIDGDWGMGKSTLLRQIEEELTPTEGEKKKTKKNRAQAIKIARFNAWTARGENALEGIIRTVLLELDSNKVRLLARKLAKNRHAKGFAKLFAAIVIRLTSMHGIIDKLWKPTEISAQAKDELRNAIQGLLEDWAAGEPDVQRTLVVFIDDLDRCSNQTILQVAEAIKLYLDAPGIIFVLACDMSVLEHGLSSIESPDLHGATNARTYLEKIIQVHHTLRRYPLEDIHHLIEKYAIQSGTRHLLDDDLIHTLSLKSGRNPRRIKRILNSFIVEHQLNPEWQEPPLGSTQLLVIIILRHLYPTFYADLVTEAGSVDPITDFLDFVALKRFAHEPPDDTHPWWDNVVEPLFSRYNLTSPVLEGISARELSEVIEVLEQKLPPSFGVLWADESLTNLLRSLGPSSVRPTVRSQLLQSEVDPSL